MLDQVNLALWILETASRLDPEADILNITLQSAN